MSSNEPTRVPVILLEGRRGLTTFGLILTAVVLSAVITGWEIDDSAERLVALSLALFFGVTTALVAGMRATAVLIPDGVRFEGRWLGEPIVLTRRQVSGVLEAPPTHEEAEFQRYPPPPIWIFDRAGKPNCYLYLSDPFCLDEMRTIPRLVRRQDAKAWRRDGRPVSAIGVRLESADDVNVLRAWLAQVR